tara:strand:+ start:1044 stop:1937 length:894 start_codon:yes stop_codon:yes gene_type:complete
MFAGPPGVGKTSAAIALMKSMFADDWASNFIELNASDERSINVIRTTVKDFSRRGVIGTYLVDGKTQPIPFNVVFLDECDNLTPDAQSALRRIMERYSKQTRFILSCNYPHRVIDPIKDRCAFSDSRFQPIDKKVIYRSLKNVVQEKDLSITEPALKLVATHSKGSMRKALNLLFSVTRVPDEAEVDDVVEIVNELSPAKAREILGLALEANRLEPDDPKYLQIHRQLDKLIETMAERGISGVEILDLFYRTVTHDDQVPLKLQRVIFESIGEAIYWTSVSQDDMLSVKTFLRRVTL